ncbi:protein NDRG3 isoform X2 [Anopheles aquasalis]|uniref:protein NDRG3 isoform X2 n=1 Tax=Anopheles aquasalis TaxID=42839 RepID=UPI00215B3144|nr:protein NDRG3 isoform X2 [Anopheles aquasalis]XP_050100195.1 protein NDRG3 isoform X2 [Anopheles aquasalis]
MPQSDGGYVSLGGGPNSIYNSTTEPHSGSKSVMETVKRVIGTAIGAQDKHGLLERESAGGPQPYIVSARDRDKTGKAANARMPSAPAHTAEEARLLGAMPVDPMDDIELRSVQLQYPNQRGSIVGSCDLRRVPTDKGDILVAVQGDTTKPAIVTYHDLGLNYASSFAGFFNFPTMRALLDNFCVYHVNAPGQEEGAPTFPEDYVYPTFDELGAQLLFVMTHFNLKSIIGLGVGAGANILARFALANPDKVGALCLINCSSTAAGWIEWGYQLLNTRNLRTKGMTQGVLDYLMWHHFGRNPEERNLDLVQLYKSNFERSINPVNLAMLIDAYIKRTDLNIARTPSGSPQTVAAPSLKMPVLNITGALSPHIDDTVTFNGRLIPEKTNWMKISDCGLVLEEQPGKLAEAFRLFLQGEGYAPTFSPHAKYHTTTATAAAAAAATAASAINCNNPNNNNNNDTVSCNRHNQEFDKLNGNVLQSAIAAAAAAGGGSGGSGGGGGGGGGSDGISDQQIGSAGNGITATANITSTGSACIGGSATSAAIYESSAALRAKNGAIRITENPLPENGAC